MLSVAFTKKVIGLELQKQGDLWWVDWHLSAPDPLRDFNCDPAMEHVLIVQADGHELNWIRDSFPGLPVPSTRVTRFYGDLARLIAGNLR